VTARGRKSARKAPRRKPKGRKPKARRKSPRRLPDPPELELPELEALPEPPALPGPPPVRGEDPSSAFAALGDPPPDDLDGQRWAYRFLLACMSDLAKDQQLTNRDRRREGVRLALASERLVPKARLRDAEETVLAHEAKVARGRRQGATLEPVPDDPPPPSPPSGGGADVSPS
jgi:hypothetical protein